MEALCARGRELLEHPMPDEALRTWLRAVAVHATAMRGLVAIEMAGAAPALAACHDDILATGEALLARTAPLDVAVADLLKLANAIGWAAEQSPEDEHLIDRLLALVTIQPEKREGAPPPK
ncbi:hypothetical protein ABZ297_10380 [Nonomuraea sp. NPDC005983]|uniref:SbtR family transcriptional regulator n=1 Tax=Nonomuraea sp. NPDC005983 TaxID=3155595 RepID=UPI0033B60C52